MESDLREGAKRSAENRAAMMARFGFIPMSILRLSRGALSRRMYTFQRERPERGSLGPAVDSIISGEFDPGQHKRIAEAGLLGDAKSIARIKARQGNERPQASTMPAELVAFFVKYYTKPGDVYLDPFMGQGIQLQVAKLYGLDYYGYDVSREFVSYIQAVVKKVDDGKTVIRAVLGDSRFPVEVPDGVGDFSFHSPPYWDIEYYGDEPEQLGRADYPTFLDGMRDVYRAWLPKFKPGAWHVVNVNDFRRDGAFYPYHADTIRVATEAGWVLHDTFIIDGLVGGMRKVFGVSSNLRRIVPKIHEYALVFRAPGGAPDKS